ncbi:Probable inactive heme oxygenase 2, chloroplastic [Linum perenne]
MLPPPSSSLSSFPFTALLNPAPRQPLLHLSTSYRTEFASVSFERRRNASPQPILCCSNSKSSSPPAVAETPPLPLVGPPVLKKTKRYRKSHPGESKGITEEMRFVAMRLRNIKGIYPHKKRKAISEAESQDSGSESDSGGDEVEEEEKEEQQEEEQGEEEEAKKVEEEGGEEEGKSETWVPSMEGFVKYLVASKLVFNTVERILDTSDEISYTHFRNNGLERSKALANDLEWLADNYGVKIPEPSNQGVIYAKYLEEIAQNSAPLFLSHLYNIYFSHIAGGRVITTQVCDQLLEGKELEFLQWEGDAQELLKGVRDKLKTLGEDSLVIKTPKKSPLVLRLVVLAFAMVCGVYICFICLKQIDSNNTLSRFINFEVVCNSSDIEPSEIPYVHYPRPVTFNREECVCNPVRYFAILSMQRSGSGWFETLMNSHINVSSNGEIFGKKDRRANVSSIVNVLDRVYNLDWISSASKNECNAAVGFKWMLNQGVLEHHEGIVDYFNRNGVHAIFLFRRNLIRRLISVMANSYDKSQKLLNGTHKSHVHSVAEAKVLAKYKPALNTSTLLAELRSVDSRTKRAISYFNSTRHIVLYYEDVVGNRTKLEQVQHFLRLPYRELTSRQIKIHSGGLSEQIANFEQVQEALKGTPYESFLRQDDEI